MANYDKLATVMATYPEMASFRAFAKLNVQNILSLQAELVHREAELSDITAENQRSGDSERRSFQFSFFDLKESAGTSKDLQWRKMLEIRRVLPTYSMATILLLPQGRLI